MVLFQNYVMRLLYDLVHFGPQSDIVLKFSNKQQYDIVLTKNKTLYYECTKIDR